jgi:dihydrodipicolinate synthase/N-acetylneuraminate lyase
VKWGLYYLKRLPSALMRLPLTELSEKGQITMTKTLDDLARNLQEY